jgi:hypothetical protein
MIGSLCTSSLVSTIQIASILFFIGIVTFVFLILKIHPFLAKNTPICAEALVVEGWLPDYAIEAAMQEFQRGNYQVLITVGSALPRGFYLSEYKNFADLAAATLIALGFNPAKLVIISADYVPECRTQTAAQALKDYLESKGSSALSMNIFSLGPHARRTWFVFRRVLAQTNVGIIAAENSAYDSRQWWKSSEGVRTVIGELIAYLYRQFSG